MDNLLALVRKHLIIKNKEILIVFAVIVLYRLTFSIFSFSILRFLIEAIGKEYFLIGLAFAVGNGIAMLIDIPLGIAQKYIQPRFFILLSILLLMISDMIFMMSISAFWLAFVAVLFYQLSVEIFFITIVTYILRMSSKKDSSQNMAQSDIADNTGDMMGIALAGMLFTIDRGIGAQNSLVILFLFCTIAALLFFVYEFADHKHQSSLEKHILDMKLNRKIIEASSSLADKLVTPDVEAAKAEGQAEKAPAEEKKIIWSDITSQIGSSMKDVARTLFGLVKDPLSAPLLVWAMLIIIITTFWIEAVTFFEPFFTKSLFKAEESIITTHFSRYLFESGMLILGLLIPTFFFEYPISKLSDKLGKEKIIVACTIIAGLGLALVSAFSKTLTFFVVFLLLGVAYSGIYPAMVGLINDEYSKVSGGSKTPAPELKGEPAKPQEEDEGSESMSAALLSILMNIGQITAGLVAGALLSILSFKLIFFLMGIGLTLIGIASLLWLRQIKPEAQPATAVAPESPAV